MTASVLTEPFMVHALLAGTIVALVCGAVGSLLVLRAQVFTADALSHVAFTGAMAALVAGVAISVGLVIACVVVAVLLALLGDRIGNDDAVIGSTFAWILGIGTLLLAIATTNGADGTSGVAVLFGSVLTISTSAMWWTLALGAMVLGAVAVLGRPLLFASVDPKVAEARGIPVLALSVALAILVGLTTAMAVQVIGALLFVGLIAAPAGAADRLTGNPARAMAWSMGLATVAVWVGLTIATLVPEVPASAAIVGVATLTFTGISVGMRRRPHAA